MEEYEEREHSQTWREGKKRLVQIQGVPFCWKGSTVFPHLPRRGGFHWHWHGSTSHHFHKLLAGAEKNQAMASYWKIQVGSDAVSTSPSCVLSPFSLLSSNHLIRSHTIPAHTISSPLLISHHTANFCISKYSLCSSIVSCKSHMYNMNLFGVESTSYTPEISPQSRWNHHHFDLLPEANPGEAKVSSILSRSPFSVGRWSNFLKFPP